MTVPEVGDVIEVREQNYRYGTGFLIMRVTRLGDPVQMADGERLNVEGLALRADGTQFDQHPRHTLVQVDAVSVTASPRSP